MIQKFLEIISRLLQEEFTQQVAGSYGSVRNTLVHAMSAVWGWLDRCGGAKRGGRWSLLIPRRQLHSSMSGVLLKRLRGCFWLI